MSGISREKIPLLPIPFAAPPLKLPANNLASYAGCHVVVLFCFCLFLLLFCFVLFCFVLFCFVCLFVCLFFMCKRRINVWNGSKSSKSSSLLPCQN